MNLDLSNYTALVCGSTQGIGFAAAQELALLGANVVLMARNEAALKEAITKLSNNKSQHHQYIIADFNNPSNVEAQVKSFVSANGTIHIVVNNTGGPAGGPITNATVEAFTQTFSQHLLCNHLIMQATIAGMKESGYGRIINVISTSVKQPLKGLGVSNTIRAAVANWSKTLSVELAPFGITVNNVLPGATSTSRLSTLIENKSKNTGASIDHLEEEMVKEIPAGRFGNPNEIGSAIAFLATPAAAYINGINLPVDGGRTGSL